METLTTGLVFIIVMGGFLFGLMLSGFIGWIICCAIGWWREEVTQEEYLTFKSEQQDWIAKRMNKCDWSSDTFMFEYDEEYAIQHDRVNEGLPPVDDRLANLRAAGLAEGE